MPIFMKPDYILVMRYRIQCWYRIQCSLRRNNLLLVLYSTSKHQLNVRWVHQTGCHCHNPVVALNNLTFLVTNTLSHYFSSDVSAK